MILSSYILIEVRVFGLNHRTVNHSSVVKIFVIINCNIFHESSFILSLRLDFLSFCVLESRVKYCRGEGCVSVGITDLPLP